MLSVLHNPAYAKLFSAQSIALTRAVTAAVLPFVTETWQIYLLIFVLQSASATFTPAFQALIPSILPQEDEYTRALSLSRLAYDLEALVSPPVLAAALLTVTSFHSLFAGTVIGFLGSATLMAATRLPRTSFGNGSGTASGTARPGSVEPHGRRSVVDGDREFGRPGPGGVGPPAAGSGTPPVLLRRRFDDRRARNAPVAGTPGSPGRHSWSCGRCPVPPPRGCSHRRPDCCVGRVPRRTGPQCSPHSSPCPTPASWCAMRWRDRRKQPWDFRGPRSFLRWWDWVAPYWRTPGSLTPDERGGRRGHRCTGTVRTERRQQ